VRAGSAADPPRERGSSIESARIAGPIARLRRTPSVQTRRKMRRAWWVLSPGQYPTLQRPPCSRIRAYCFTSWTATMLNLAYFSPILSAAWNSGELRQACSPLQAFPAKDHNWSMRQASRNLRAWFCRNIRAAVIFDRFL